VIYPSAEIVTLSLSDCSMLYTGIAVIWMQVVTAWDTILSSSFFFCYISCFVVLAFHWSNAKMMMVAESKDSPSFELTKTHSILRTVFGDFAHWAIELFCKLSVL